MQILDIGSNVIRELLDIYRKIADIIQWKDMVGGMLQFRERIEAGSVGAKYGDDKLILRVDGEIEDPRGLQWRAGFDVTMPIFR